MSDWTLAIDTSTYTQVIALMRDGQVLSHIRQEPPRHHGNMLLKAIDEILTLHSTHAKDLGLIVTGVGPGSFTGLRVGIACAKGLALATGCPIVGISTLKTLAYHAARNQPGALVVAAVDARKREVYAGGYTWSADTTSLTTIIEEQAIAPAACRAMLEAQNARVLAGFMVSKYDPLRPTPSDTYVTLEEPLLAPDAVALAMLGRQKFATTQASELDSLEPNYIRPSDAEISLKKREAARAAQA